MTLDPVLWIARDELRGALALDDDPYGLKDAIVRSRAEFVERMLSRYLCEQDEP